MNPPAGLTRKNLPTNPLLYEINTAVWLSGLSRRHGRPITFDAIPSAEIDSIASHGFNLVWLMGIWKRSAMGRIILLNDDSSRADFARALPNWTEDQVIGSPVAVASYQPDPRFGTWQSLAKLRSQFASRGMGLALDVVANHTAVDHPWVALAPRRYILGADGDLSSHTDAFFKCGESHATIIAKGRDPFFPAWPDTAQLNIFDGETRRDLIAEFRAVADNCDTIVAHMAQLSLNDVFQNNWGGLLGSTAAAPHGEFWKEAITATRKTMWIAEAYWDTEWALQQLGFDYTFDKKFYDSVLSGNAAAVGEHLRTELEFQRRSVRFIENHNEPRAAYAFGEEHLKAPAVLLATIPGMRLFHGGQLEVQKVRVPLPMTAARDTTPSLQVMGLYDKLLQLSHSEVLADGQWLYRELSRAYDDTSDQLIAYSWTHKTNLLLVVVNPGHRRAQGMAPLYDTVDPTREYLLVDELTGIRYRRQGKQLFSPGLHVILDPFDAHILRITTV
jgi:Alpha amylase, catalytic domain